MIQFFLMKLHPISLKKIILFLCLAAVTMSSTLFAQLEEQAVSFQTGDRQHRVEVRTTKTGCDVFRVGKEIKNLSACFPGENLFPIVTVSEPESYFTVAWMHYQRGNVQLCLYDSLTDHTQWLPLENFSSAYPLKTIFYDDTPYLLLFVGNNSDNTDIFYYHLAKGYVENITRTPHSEQRFEIVDRENKVFIETGTLFRHRRFRLKKQNLMVTLIEETAIEREIPDRIEEPGISFIPVINTILGFGDSITYGVIRMDPANPDDYYHPEQAYLEQLKETLGEDYGEVAVVNRGVSRNTSLQGVERMHQVFSEANAFFCLVMFGTNDVVFPTFDADASTENLEFILDTARYSYDMYPIISTIPPQKNEQITPHIQFYKDNTEALNAGIIEMATRNDVAYIDTYTAFIESRSGWELLLERVKGNHPSPLGHAVIADLFKAKILVLPPAAPAYILKKGGSAAVQTFEWAPNPEFDFSHYVVEFGYAPGQLDRFVTVSTNQYSFINFPFYAPFYSRLYFRIQPVDMDLNAGDFTPVQEIRFE